MKREDLRVGGTVYVPKSLGWSRWTHGVFEIVSIGHKYAKTDTDTISINIKTLHAMKSGAELTVPVYRGIEEYLEVQEQGRFISAIKEKVRTTAIIYDQAVKIQAILEQQP